MEKFALPNSELEISRLIFGCWAIVGGFNWGPQDERDSLAAIKMAYDQGITTFDTAEAYGGGASEDLLAKALGEKRKDIIIASKAGPADFAPEDIKKACERGLKNLKTDYIDLYQLHWPNPEIPLEETLGALQELRNEGKIRAFGVSNFGNKSLETCKKSSFKISSNQMAYNLLFRAIEYSILPQCISDGVPVLCYSPIMQGLLTGKFSSETEVPDDRARTRHFTKERPQSRHQEDGCEELTFQTISQIKDLSKEANIPMGNLSLAWLLHQEGIAAAIVGGRNAAQVRKNAASAQLALTPALVAALNDITRPLKEALGPNADLWQSESRVV
ncbi:aldo/keto reductase [Cyclobacterium jeungdonense]|uniref:Aldo/keto reductase n=1 Tax=Cyclobacterium jeungdonense TaxID=708087 RepID=A0ABT8CCK7_9BACT|nr:aldo/keto reductase [Cyclobacterium jeungdonense]MDN3690529.1 aldo/keto reductase [Cyclobacterium jeungdonense]